MHDRTIGALLVLLAGVFWGTFGTFASFLPPGVPALFVGAAKLAFGAIGLAIILAIRGRGSIISTRSHLPARLLILAAMALALTQTAIYLGIRSAGVTIATMVFIGTPPLFSGIYAQVMKHERQSLSWLVSSIVIASGCTFMALSGENTTDGNRLLVGSLLAATAGASWTYVGTLLRNLQRHAGPLESSFIVMGSAALFLLPIAATQGFSWMFEPRVMIISVALGLVSTAIPYWLFTTGARKIPASHAFLYGLTEPITASFLGLVVLGEHLGSIGSIGYVQVVIGLVLFSVWEFKKTRALDMPRVH